MALRSSQGERKIFSTLAELDGRQGKRTSAFSKRWTRFTTDIGVKSGRQKTFHSFRHTFKRAMRNAQVDGNLTDAIQGHSNRSVSAHYGRDKDGMGYALPVLFEAISKVGMNNDPQVRGEIARLTPHSHYRQPHQNGPSACVIHAKSVVLREVLSKGSNQLHHPFGLLGATN